MVVPPHNIYYYYLNLEHVFEVLKMLLARKLNLICSDQAMFFKIRGHAFQKYFFCQVEYSIAELQLTLTQPGFYCSTRRFAVRWKYSLIFKRKNKNYPSAKCENVAELAVQLSLIV